VIVCNGIEHCEPGGGARAAFGLAILSTLLWAGAVASAPAAHYEDGVAPAGALKKLSIEELMSIEVTSVSIDESHQKRKSKPCARAGQRQSGRQVTV
jgi:hypothetical protein